MFAQLSHQLLCEFFPRYEIVVKNSYLFGQLCFSADKAIFTLLCVNKQIKTFRDIINSQLYCIRRFFFVRIRNASNCDEQKMPTIQTHFFCLFYKVQNKVEVCCVIRSLYSQHRMDSLFHINFNYCSNKVFQSCPSIRLY